MNIYLTYYLTSKWRKITILIALYTIILTVFFEDSDFTGIIEIGTTVDKIHKKMNAQHNESSEIELITTLLDKILERFIFVIVTISSVGYGDVVPKTKNLRIVNTLFIIVLIYTVFNS